MGQSFEQWLDEIENFSSRRERAREDLGPDYERWLRSAWKGGMHCEDNSKENSSNEQE